MKQEEYFFFCPLEEAGWWSSMWPVLQRLHAEQCGVSGAFYALLALEAQKDKDGETERNREEKAAPLLSLRRAVALERVGPRQPPSPASTRRLTPESKFPIGACGFAPLLCLRNYFRTSALHPLCVSLQCGGFIVPWPRCCFCFCCMRSCSSAEGPGCIIELDQIDWGQTSMFTKLNCWKKPHKYHATLPN